jgi:hypothetical protein
VALNDDPCVQSGLRNTSDNDVHKGSREETLHDNFREGAPRPRCGGTLEDRCTPAVFLINGNICVYGTDGNDVATVDHRGRRADHCQVSSTARPTAQRRQRARLCLVLRR